ncbi:MAG: cell division protein FtsL [Bacillota bacterium]
MNKLLPARKPGEYIPVYRGSTPYRPAKPSYERHVQPKKTIAFSGEAMLFCALILLLIITGVGLIGMHGRVVAINYRVQQVNREISRLQEEREYLNIEVKKLASLERIEHIAINELGMQYPEKRQWLLLSSRGNITN